MNLVISIPFEFFVSFLIIRDININLYSDHFYFLLKNSKECYIFFYTQIYSLMKLYLNVKKDSIYDYVYD